jgi:pimeloyl-ACP methyl ester carboxylesterase
VERFVEVEPGIRLWVTEAGDRAAEPLLLIMGANASGLTWPDPLVDALAARHRVIRYDHRDTGRSSWAFDTTTYSLAQLAEDAVAVLDVLGVARTHVAGMSLGGSLVQLLLVDHPERLLSATLWSTAALGSWTPRAGPEASALPGPDPLLLELWEHLTDPRDREAELEFRVEHWRRLRGAGPFDPDEFRRQEERMISHAGRHDSPAAHARADPAGLERAADLNGISTPTLVIDAPQDPVNPPPHAAYLASVIPGAELVTVPGLGHALGSDVLPALTEAILRHTATHPG